jgi:hypothetical protein
MVTPPTEERKKNQFFFSLSLSPPLLRLFHFIFKPTHYVAFVDIKKTTY